MEDEKKTKRLLIEELNELRQCVAELKGFEEEIKQTRVNHEKFTKAFLQNSIPVSITTLKEGRFVDVSDAFLRLMGRKRDEVIGHTSIEIGFITEEQRAFFSSELNKRGHIENLEMKVGTKGGALRYGLFNAVMMSIKNQKYLLTVMTDITDRKSIERALAEEHQRLSSILDGSPVSSFVIDRDRRVTAWNIVNEFFTGISKEDILGKPLDLSPLFKDRVPPALADLVLEMSDEEIVKRYGHKGIRKSDIHPAAFESIGKIWIKGKEHIMAIQATRFRDVAGNVIGAIQCAQDITNQKHFEETLRKSEEKYRNIFENSTEGIYQVSPEGRFITANPAAARMLGYESPEELIGTITDVGSQVYAYPEDRDKTVGLIKKDGFFRNLEVRNRQKNGSIVWVLTNGRTVRDDQGTILYHEGTSVDITDRKQAEEALRKSEQQFRNLIEQIPLGIFTYEGTKFRYVNPACERITGYTPWELYRMEVLDISKPEFRDSMKYYMQQRQRGEQVPKHHEFKILTKTGEERWLERFAIELQGEKEPVVLVTVSDITDRKGTEEILKKSEEKHRVLLENASDAILITDLNGKILQANRKAEEFLGFTKEDLLQMNYTQIHPMHELERTIEAFNNIVKNGHVLLQDGRVLRKDEKEVPVDITGTVIEYAGQKVVQGSFRDITEQKKTKDALEQLVKERTAEIVKKNRQLVAEIKKCKSTEAALLRKGRELHLHSIKLQQLNAALKILLKQREEDRRDLEEKVLSNVKHLINPNLEILKKRKLDSDSKTYLDILESNLKNIISPFSHTLSSKFRNLTPAEIKVANMIRNEKTTKEMAEFMGVSASAISHHRYHIRSKLGILTQKINLRSYLLSLS
jgi:PAS domain S-box-containing protein